MQNGLFIMIEGTDGSGKGTQTNLLVERLQKEGREVEQISFPQYGEKSAGMVEDYLTGKYGTADKVGPYKASIFFAADRYDGSFKIRQWLNENKVVIANRYIASNMGHQGGKIKNPEERKKFFDWNYNLEYNIFEIPKPDINIILHVTPKISQELVQKKEAREYLSGGKKDIHESDLNHLRDAEKAYLDIATNFPEFELIECVENNQILSQENIHNKIWNIVNKNLN